MCCRRTTSIALRIEDNAPFQRHCTATPFWTRDSFQASNSSSSSHNLAIDDSAASRFSAYSCSRARVVMASRKAGTLPGQLLAGKQDSHVLQSHGMSNSQDDVRFSLAQLCTVPCASSICYTATVAEQSRLGPILRRAGADSQNAAVLSI